MVRHCCCDHLYHTFLIKKRTILHSAVHQKRNRPTRLSILVDAMIFPSGIQRFFKLFFSSPLLVSHLHRQSTSIGRPTTSTLRVRKHTGYVTKGQATASHQTISVAEEMMEELLKERKKVSSRKKNFIETFI